MGEAVIVSAVRTPIADAYKGALANTSIYDIGKASVVEALKRSGVPAEDVDDLILGEVLQGGGDIARYIANDVGLPPDTPGLALNRQCATGMTAVDTAAANIRAGMDKVVIAGGAESMTQSPTTYRKPGHAYGIMEQWLSPSHPEHSRSSQHEHDDHRRREHRPQGRRVPRGDGRVVVRVAHEGPRRHRRRSLRRRDRADGGQGLGR